MALTVLLGAGCLSVPDNKAQIESSLYSSTDLGFEVSYPASWHVDHNGAPDPSLVAQTYFQPTPAKGAPLVSIWVFSEQSDFYAEEAAKDDAVTGRLGDNFYVINYEGDIAREDFAAIVDSFHPLMQTAMDCADFSNPAHPEWLCYKIADAYKLFHPSDWRTSGQGDAGVFVLDEAAVYVDYTPKKFLSANDVASLTLGGADALITNRNKTACDNAETTCAALLPMDTAIFGEQNVSLFHYQESNPRPDDPGVEYEGYVMGMVVNDTYYQMRLQITADVSDNLQTRLLAQFKEVAKTFSASK